MTLSYRWGAISLPITTLSNFEQRRKNIPWSILPKAFQDAIYITRKLGVNYLWIDSICIIQDSNFDWECEAKNMANIYAGSYLTLAATSAPDTSQGLVDSRFSINEEGNLELTQEYEMQPHYKNGESACLVFARRPVKYSHVALLTLDYEVAHIKKAPVLSRAWVLQERLLSPRTLNFCFEELVWECKTGIECECGYGTSASGRAKAESLLGRNIFKELFTNVALADVRISDETSEFDQEEEFLLAWYRLVVYYTTLSITKTSDRLPALRGMTTYLEQKKGWTYLDGIWMHDFVRGALFSRKSSRVCRRRNDAPTWSWASTEVCDDWVPNDYISFPLATMKESWKVDKGFRIVDYSGRRDLLDEDVRQFENLKLGYKPFIAIEAASLKATIVCEVEKLPEPSESQDGNEESQTPEIEMSLFDNENPNLISVTWDVADGNSFAEISEGNDVLAILLAHDFINGNKMSGRGLVLKGHGNGFYTRLGLFCAPDSQGHFCREEIKQVVLM